MVNINNLERTTKFVQGSIWHWENNNEEKAGVQCSDRPVLIISNNTFNQFSPSVNCVSITSILKPSPVHVPLFLSKDSHIQCEQIHTITKAELTKYIGMASENTMSNVKTKLKFQFDIGADQNTKLLLGMKQSIDDVQSRTADVEAVNKILAALNDLADKLDKKESPVIAEQAADEPTASEPDEEEAATEQDEPSARNKYTAQDYMYIADKKTATEAIMKKYGLTKQGAYRVRSFSKKWLAKNAVKEVGAHRYTDEDVKFILDETHTADELIKRFGFGNKKAAYRARSYVRKAYTEATS